MIRQHSLRLWLLLCTMTAALMLSGCGGGSSGTTPTTTPDDSATISGTAAAGAPVSGFVGARDANGETLNTNLGADGSFELDLSGLDTPVLLYASGIAGGNAYQMLSVAFADDLNGTTNITPLTDLIVGNAVGRNPQEFFNNPDFDLIRQTAIETQEEALKTRLKPLLDALGVEDDFDLRNSPFTANRTGFDAVLDVIEVQIDPDANTATIINRVNPTQTITNNFVQPESEETALEVDETEINEGVTTLQALNTLAISVATALENNDRQTLETLLAANFLNNGESAADWLDRLLGTEDAGELAEDLRNWSLANQETGQANLNVGSPNGPWQAINDNGDWKLAGNGLQFFATSEATYIVENGAEPPVVQEIATSLFASNPVQALGAVSTSSVSVTGPQATPFNTALERGQDRFGTFFVIDGSNGSQIQAGDEYSFTWTGDTIAESTYRVRRGSPQLSEGAPFITVSSADLEADEYTFEWTLPPGYESVSVRNNFTGQTTGGEGGGFTGNPLDNDAREFTGALPETYVPSETDELRLIARDPFGVFVAARLENPFADQVPPPMAENALVGSWIVRNPDRSDNAPFIQLTFLESGYYMHLELDLPYRTEADDAGNAGMELGRYQWDNQTGVLTVPEILVDGNGFWGLTDTANGEASLALQVDGNTLIAYEPSVGVADGTVFTRAPLNASGITGSWLIQDATNPALVSVVTLLEDGFYFVGTNEPADQTGSPGLEFGTYTYNSETLVLDPMPVIDQNGEFGLSDPIQGFDYATVINGSLVVDDGEAFQLSEVAAGTTPSNGGLTVDYTPPASGPVPDPAFGISGDFHYLRSSSAIEGERSGGPASLYLASYTYPGTSITDNGDGTGAISYTNECRSDVLIDAGIGEAPLFDTVAFCLGAGGSQTDLTFTEAGATLVLPAEDFTNDSSDQERLGSSSVDLFATDDSGSLLLGFGKRTFEYEDGTGFTSGVETGVHAMGEKGSGMVPGDLEGNWGLISFQLNDIDGFPNDIEYGANALSVSVDNQGAATLTNEEVLRVIQGGNTLDPFVNLESESRNESAALGNFTLTGDGELGLFAGEFAGFLALNQNLLFMSAPDPGATGLANDLGFHEWIAGVRRGTTPLQAADLVGKQYARFGQFYWVTPEFFELDYAKPGATLTFPIDSSIAEYRRELEFSYTRFQVNSPVFTGESSNTVGYDFDYTVDAEGLLRLTTTISNANFTDDVVELGWANADASVIVVASQYARTPSDGTGTVGGVGISYLVCTNCN